MAPSQLSNSKNENSILLQPKRKCRNNKDKEIKDENNKKIQKLSSFDHEELIRKILSKPFIVPIPNYVPDGYSNRCLGLKRSIIRR